MFARFVLSLGVCLSVCLFVCLFARRLYIFFSLCTRMLVLLTCYVLVRCCYTSFSGSCECVSVCLLTCLLACLCVGQLACLLCVFICLFVCLSGCLRISLLIRFQLV